METENVFAVVLGVVLLGAVAGMTKSCVTDSQVKAEQNAADNRTAQACIASGRPSLDCALIVRGTGR